MRTVYLGTSEFAATVLARLAATPEHRPALVITRPDRPKGRGRKLAAPPVSELARELGLDLLQPNSVNDEPARAAIAAVRPDIVCVCAFGALIKEPLLSDYPIVNVHPSLLPRWRGAAPIERAIMAGDERTGVSIMRLTAGLDSGPVALQEPEPIAAHDTYGTLAPRLATVGAELLLRALDDAPEFVEQDDQLATYADKITAEDRLLRPERPALELERTVRALEPHIGARLALDDGCVLGVHDARVIDEVGADGERPPGALSLDGPRPRLQCAPGTLELVVVQPPGGRAMSAEDYLRGHRR